jgi:hypothetical protein
VNVFWVARAEKELERIAELLRSGGVLQLFYEPPAAAKADAMREKLLSATSAAGFESTATTAPQLLTVVARKR